MSDQTKNISDSDNGTDNSNSNSNVNGGDAKNKQTVTTVINGFTGLRNIGNTCYMNSTIQCLSHTIPLTKYLLEKLKIEDSDRVKKTFPVLQSYTKLIYHLWTNNKPDPTNPKNIIPIVPQEFKKILSIFQILFNGRL